MISSFCVILSIAVSSDSKKEFFAISENNATYLNKLPHPRQGVPHPAEAFVLCLAVHGRYHSAALH